MEKILKVIFCILMTVILFGVSWIATCGIIKLITLCFGLEFRWLPATGIWIILIVLKNIFSSSKGK